MKFFERFIRSLRPLGATRANSLTIAVIYAIYSLSLLLQPKRWAATPAYHNLLILMSQQSWGIIFGVIAGLLGYAVVLKTNRTVNVFVLVSAIALTTFWDVAFVVRWATSANTTPETWTSWFVFDFVLIRALHLLNYQEVRIPRINGKGG